MEHILKPGDLCRDCERLGLKKYLHYFYINVNDRILKCESNQCLYPYEDDGYDADSIAPIIDEQQPVNTELQQYTEGGASEQLIEDLLKEPTSPFVSEIEETKVTPILDAIGNCKSLKKEEPDFTITKIEKIENWTESRSAVPETSAPATECFLHAAAATSASNEIPEARITRFLDAIKAHKSTPHTNVVQNHRKTSRPKGESQFRKHKIRFREQNYVSVPKCRPLDLMKGIMKAQKRD